MRFLRFWRRHEEPPSRRAPSEGQETPPPVPPVDFSQPRECIFKRFEGDPGPCPRCGGPLHPHHAAYWVETRQGDRLTDSFVIGGKMGWFCARCPTVVIDPNEIVRMLRYQMPSWEVGNEFRVEGIVVWHEAPEGTAEDEEEALPEVVPFSRITVEGDLGSLRPSKEKKRPKQAGKARKKARRRRRRG